MRLRPDIVGSADAYLNPLGERELSLRGLKVPAIENLGVTEDEFESIDLSDNEILFLDNVPLLKRLTTLMLNNNRVSRISESLGRFVPKLSTLILTNNRLKTLDEIKPLASLGRSLLRLSLLGNPVTQVEHYRLFTIHILPRLVVLDFSKVRPAERAASEKLFGPPVQYAAEDEEGGLALDVPAVSAAADDQGGVQSMDVDGESASGAATASVDPVAAASAALRHLTGGDDGEESKAAPKVFKPGVSLSASSSSRAATSAADRAKIQAAIKNAGSLEEMNRIQGLLARGNLPTGAELDKLLKNPSATD